MAFTGFSSDEEGSIVYDGEKFIVTNPEQVSPDFRPGEIPVIGLPENHPAQSQNSSPPLEPIVSYNSGGSSSTPSKTTDVDKGRDRHKPIVASNEVGQSSSVQTMEELPDLAATGLVTFTAFKGGMIDFSSIALGSAWSGELYDENRIVRELSAIESYSTIAEANIENDEDDNDETVDGLTAAADLLLAIVEVGLEDASRTVSKLLKTFTKAGGVGTIIAGGKTVIHAIQGNRQEAADTAYIGLSSFFAGLGVGLVNPIAGVGASIVASEQAESHVKAHHEYCATPGNCVDRMVAILTLEDRIAALYPHLKPADIPFTSREEAIRAIVYKHMPNASQEERDRAYRDVDHLYTLGENGFPLSDPNVQMKLFYIGRRGVHFSPEQARDIHGGRLPQTENDIFVIDGISAREAQTGVIPTAGAKYDFDLPATTMVSDWMDTHNSKVWMGGFVPNDYPYPYIYRDGEAIFPDEYQFAFDTDKGPAGALLIAALVERDTDPQTLQEVANILVTDHGFNLGPIERDVIVRRFQSFIPTSSEEYIDQTLVKLESVFNNQ